MQNKLYNILVPVDFTGKNKWAIAKAIELANNFDCNIHLVHIVFKPVLPFVPVDVSKYTPYASHISMQSGRAKLAAMKANYKNQLCGNGEIEISLLQGHPQQQLLQYIQSYNMDMVVIGLSRFNLVERIISSVSISLLAKKTDIPILTVRSGGLVSHFKKIVLPLNNDIPVQRVKLATMLARSFRSTVYLVSLRTERQPEQSNLLDKTLELVQSVSIIPVQCFLLEGQNLAKSTLDFSRRINADLIVGQCGKEFRLPGLWSKFTNKILSYASKIPVLTFGKTA
ncbi:MAG: universal stress protein [Chitinophagaceae bacterium]|nr:universal stress protein [Chitinophagaceae bacterium]